MRRANNNRPDLPDVEEEEDPQTLSADDPRSVIKVLFEPARDAEKEPETKPPPSPHSLSGEHYVGSLNYWVLSES